MAVFNSITGEPVENRWVVWKMEDDYRPIEAQFDTIDYMRQRVRHRGMKYPTRAFVDYGRELYARLRNSATFRSAFSTGDGGLMLERLGLGIFVRPDRSFDAFCTWVSGDEMVTLPNETSLVEWLTAAENARPKGAQ